MREHMVEILWAGNVKSQKTVTDALYTTARERDPGTNVFLILVPTTRLHEATTLILAAGGKILNVKYR